MESRIKYGVFWQPKVEIKDFILKWKRKVTQLEPDAKYLSHPVHSTFFLFISHDKHFLEIEKNFSLLKNSISKKAISFYGWHIFENDLATGGDTLTLRINLSDQLIKTQQIIAELMYPLATGKIDYPIEWPGVLGTSYQKWGFPFVGSHWVPHLSIASIRNKGKLIIPEALNSSFPQATILHELSLVEIKGEQHKTVKTIYL